MVQFCKNVPNYPEGNCSAEQSETGLQATHIIYGSFSAVNAKEAVVNYDGCEAHGDMYGGSILLKQTEASWKISGFLPGFRSQTCLKFSQPNTKDTLVCHSSTFLTGTEVTSVNALSIQNGKLWATPLLLTQKPDSSQICSTGRKSELSSITQWKMVATGSKQTLTVEGEYLSEPPPKECSATSAYPDIDKLDAWVTKYAKPYKINFEITGNRIVVSAKDKPMKSLLDKIGRH